MLQTATNPSRFQNLTADTSCGKKSVCAGVPVSCSHPHDFINDGRQGSQTEGSASLPPPWFVCNWSVCCLLTHYLLCFLVELCLCSYLAAGCMVLFTYAGLPSVGTVQRGKPHATNHLIDNYHLWEACRYKLFSLTIRPYASQKLVIFFVWSLTHNAVIIIISLHFGARGVPLEE